MVHMCRMIVSPGFFLHFSQILVFRVNSGVKGQKWHKMTKNCLSHSISQEAYIVWWWFLVHMCKMMTSPDAFFIFEKFDFLFCEGGLKGKKWPKMAENFVSLHISGTILYMIGFWYTCVKWWYPAIFFIFSKFWFFGVLEEIKGKNGP